jgi:hypothetical protein
MFKKTFPLYNNSLEPPIKFVLFAASNLIIKDFFLQKRLSITQVSDVLLTFHTKLDLKKKLIRRQATDTGKKNLSMGYLGTDISRCQCRSSS